MQGARLADLLHFDIDRAEAVERAAEDLFAHALVDRQGFARHDGLIDGSLACENRAVHGNPFAGQDAQHIAAHDLFERDHFLPAVSDSPTLRRRKREEILQAFLRTLRNRLFEKCAERHDEGDLARREEIADGNRCKHRHRDQKRRRNLADAAIVNDAPNGQVEQRNAADDDRNPCGVERQNLQGRRFRAELFYHMRHEIEQQECRRHERHGKARKKIVEPLE